MVGGVQPADIASLAVHLMTTTALTGGTYDIDGGQQLIRAHPAERGAASWRSWNR
jgi:hypothetical protein